MSTLGVTREDVEQEDSDRFWAEHALGSQLEGWCWEDEPLDLPSPAGPQRSLVAELQKPRMTSPARGIPSFDRLDEGFGGGVRNLISNGDTAPFSSESQYSTT